MLLSSGRLSCYRHREEYACSAKTRAERPGMQPSPPVIITYHVLCYDENLSIKRLRDMAPEIANPDAQIIWARFSRNSALHHSCECMLGIFNFRMSASKGCTDPKPRINDGHANLLRRGQIPGTTNSAKSRLCVIFNILDDLIYAVSKICLVILRNNSVPMHKVDYRIRGAPSRFLDDLQRHRHISGMIHVRRIAAV